MRTLSIAVALSICCGLAPAQQPADILIDAFDSATGWGTIPGATFELDKAGHRGACFKVTFGGPGQDKKGLIQGPPPGAAQAWAKRGAALPNAFAFWARAEQPMGVTMNLRVRHRGVSGPAGVVATIRAETSLDAGDWRRVVVPFTAFSHDPALPGGVGPELFATYDPQPQFAASGGAPAAKAQLFWLDELAFATLSPEETAALAALAAAKGPSASPKPKESAKMNWTGLELATDIARDRERYALAQPPAWRALTAPGVTAAAPAGARQTCDLLTGWTFMPVDAAGKLGKPTAVTLPHHFAGGRDYRAGWYVSRQRLERRPGERLIARFGEVPLFCVLFVDGAECGRHLGSFTPFEFDITDRLPKAPAAATAGAETLLALYVHDASAAIDGGRAYNQLGVMRPQQLRSGMGGVYGAVRLERRPAAYVGDVFVKTSTRKQELSLVCELVNTTSGTQSSRLEFTILEWPDAKAVELKIPAEQIELAPAQTKTVTVRVPWADPRLWSPEHPNLYLARATLTPVDPAGQADGADLLDTRFGFREFWIEGKQFMLNGAAIRLRGESNYRSGRLPQSFDLATGRDFNREMIRLFKQTFDSNACRVHANIGPASVALGADEAGYLLINQSSIWSAMGGHYRQGGQTFLDNTRREFAEWVRRDRNSPSVVIWDVENEMIRSSRESKSWAMQFDSFVLAHDDTRPIEHSGAGWYDKDQQIVHLHMQEHYTEILEMWRDKGAHPVVMGEFWIGGRGETRLPSSLEFRSEREWYEEEARINEENMLEMRYFGCSGVMPFRTSSSTFVRPADGRELFAFKPGAPPAADVRSPAALARIRHGLQPLTAFFWPRVESAATGQEFKCELVVCNDTESSRELTAEWALQGQSPRAEKLRLAPGEQKRFPISVTAPGSNSQLTARLLEGGQVVSSDALTIRAIAPAVLAAPALKRQLVVYEGAKPGAAQALRELGLAPTVSTAPPADPKNSLWLIAPLASDRALNRQAQAIRSYLEGGGRILCLAQEQFPRWSPVKLEFWPAIRAVPGEFVEFGWRPDSKGLYYSQQAPIYAAGHPAFAGVAAAGVHDLRWWSPSDGRVGDDALVRPAAVGVFAPGAWRVLAGGCRTENASIVEARVGGGSTTLTAVGTLVLCQAHVLRQRQTPEARAVLMNLLRYLDGAAWQAGSGRVRLAGALAPQKLSAITGAPAAVFEGASAERGDTLIATDGAAIDELTAWANAGGAVLVLSAEVAKRLPGYAVEKRDNMTYAGAHGADHPLFWGVASTNFTGFDKPCVDGALTAHPKSAKVLLHGLMTRDAEAKMTGNDIGRRGLTTMDAAPGPVAVAEARGKGALIVTTLAPWRAATPHDAELMSLLLANAGVAIPAPEQQPREYRVLKTVPLKIDGRLDDWTNDVEDRNVSPYRHAQPIVLSSEDAVGGSVSGDSEFSAIVYFLWNDQSFCVAGAIFGGDDKARVQLRVVDRTIDIGPSPGGLLAKVDGGAGAGAKTAQGRARSEELTDARALSFTVVDRRVGNLLPAKNVNGGAFEAELPWGALRLSQPPAESLALIRIERGDGVALQAPVNGNDDDPATWIKLDFAD